MIAAAPKLYTLGTVKTAQPDFGFIQVQDSDQLLYFKQPQNPFQVGDRAVFNVNHSGSNVWATRIQKAIVRTNLHGLQFVNPFKSTHIHEGTKKYLARILDTISSWESAELRTQTHFEEVVGLCNCVETNSSDVVSFHIRKDRTGHSRFVHHRSGIPCRSITTILERHENFFQIKTCYIGQVSFPEPYSPLAGQDAFEYWMNHAFVIGSESVRENTGVHECPWQLNQQALCDLK